MDEELEESEEVYIPEMESPLAPAAPLCNEMLGVAIEALHLDPDYLDFFKKNILSDLEEFCSLPTKQKLKEYSIMLQKQYVASDTSEISEINVKRILTAVVPKLINENQELQNSNPDKSIVTKSDENIVKYFTGAMLRGGLKKFHNEEKS